MLTLFAIPKSFHGHVEVIQGNAITSWTLLRPRPEIILFGDDYGTAEVAQTFGVCHVPEVARNEYGTPLVNDLFEKAQRLASHDLLCYINADIILMSDFMRAVEQVARRKRHFVIVEQRWDVDLTETWDFHQPDWEARLRAYVQEQGELHPKTGIDYFVFPRGLFGAVPPFAIGRPAWDNWMIYRARSLMVPVIDVTKAAMIVHQNHGYTHVLGGEEGPEVRENLRLAGGFCRVFDIAEATHSLSTNGIKLNLGREYFSRRLDTLPILFPCLRPIALYLRILTRNRLARTLWPINSSVGNPKGSSTKSRSVLSILRRKTGSKS